MKKYFSIILLGLLIISACQKVDLFDYDLPEGRISGNLVWQGDNSPANDLWVLIKNNDTEWLDLTFTNNDGVFTINRMPAANYSVTIFNDSIIAIGDYTFDLADDEEYDVGAISVDLAPLPVFENFTVLENNSTSALIRLDVNDGGNTVVSRGVKILPASDTRDPAVSGASLTANWRDTWDLTFWEQDLTGLAPETEYKLKAYVTIYRGLTSSGGKRLVYVYSDEYTFTTAAEAK